MHTFLRRIFDWSRKKPFFIVLLVGMGIAGALSLKPDQAMLGWDNYSSYFRPDFNVSRLFFSTWREFRGLGVPSDAEVTEIGRLLFYGLFRVFVGENLLDQIYHLFAFMVGGIMMYKLADRVIRTYDTEHKFVRAYDFFAFLGAFFYIFNFNTLSVFYFPMPMFVIRFYALPLIFYVFLKFLHEKHIPLWKLFLYGGLIFLSTGAYIVPTVFITVCMTLGFLFISQRKFLLKSFLIIIFFILLNSYWLFPFANYTIEKGKMLPRAPTFVAINESQLNKESAYFTPLRQLTFYPQFFEMYFSNSGGSRLGYFHPIAEMVNKYPSAFGVVTAFPILYLLGGIFLLVIPNKKKHSLLWIPGILFTFIFLTLKEYSPLGIIYGFFSTYIPFFEMIFRFGDTKFHPFIAFSGSLSASFALLIMYTWFRRIVRKEYIIVSFCLLFMLPTLVLFKDMYSGNLIGFFMFSKIPEAYKNLAQDINTAKGYGRVLHLPFEETTQYYWRPYSWGYFGSAFFHYFINKPYLDRTFEPASMENAFVHKQIIQLTTGIQTLPTEGARKVRAERLYRFFQNIGVRHIIIDESISINQEARGYTVWGNVNLADARKVAELLEVYGYAKRVREYTINLEAISKAYRGYPFTKPRIENDPPSLFLYTLNDIPEKITAIQSLVHIESVPEDSITRPVYEEIPHYREGKGSIVPFARGDGQLSQEGTKLSYKTPIQSHLSDTYTLSFSGTQTQSLVELEIRRVGEDFSLILTKHVAPSVGEQDFKIQFEEISLPEDIGDIFETPAKRVWLGNEWTLSGEGSIQDEYRIRVGGVVFPVIIPEEGRSVSLGALVAEGSELSVELLKREKQTPLNLQSFRDIPNSGCYNDALEKNSADLQLSTPTLLTAMTKNGSLCMWSELKDLMDEKTTHIEIESTISGKSQDLEGLSQYGNDVPTAKPRLKTVVQSIPKPAFLVSCLRERSLEMCLAETKFILGETGRRVRITSSRSTNNMLDPMLFLALRTTGFERAELELRDAVIDSYESTEENEITIPQSPSFLPFVLSLTNELELSFPADGSRHSSYLDLTQDAPGMFSDQCNKYQTLRRTEKGLLAFGQGCESTFFITKPYSSQNMYVWGVEYSLGSGQYPIMIMGDENTNYRVERVSFLTGYPTIPGFRAFQDPETIFTNERSIREGVMNPVFSQAIEMIYPESDTLVTKDRSYYLRQTTDNEGLMTVSKMLLTRVPSHWSTLTLTPQGGNESVYALTQNLTFSRILPSLWKFSFDPAQDPVMIKFAEGYDRQWGVYGSLKDVMIGSPIANSMRCDGFANCFEIAPENQRATDLYLFYWPERLAVLGWSLTVLSVICAVISFLFFRGSRSS